MCIWFDSYVTVGAVVALGRRQLAVESVMRGARGGFRACYDRTLRESPMIAGRVAVQFTITTQGRVTGLVIAENTTAAAPLAECILRRIRGLVFPAPMVATTVTVPLTLSVHNRT